jgi:hypothetical protein
MVMSAMVFNLSDALNSVSAMVGVNPGYDGNHFAVTDPLEAARLVDVEVKKSTIPAVVFPGRVLYPRDRGCPEEGEAIGAVFATSSFPNLMTSFNKIRLDLKQSTVSVITPPDSGVRMTGFVVALGQGNLREIAHQWPEIAADQYNRSGFHVSAALYETGPEIFAQAEANPTRISDLGAWRTNAQAIIKAIKPDAEPVFRSVGYHYLKD